MGTGFIQLSLTHLVPSLSAFCPSQPQRKSEEEEEEEGEENKSIKVWGEGEKETSFILCAVPQQTEKESRERIIIDSVTPVRKKKVYLHTHLNFPNKVVLAGENGGKRNSFSLPNPTKKKKKTQKSFFPDPDTISKGL